MKKHITFPLSVLGLLLSTAGAGWDSPSACCSDGILLVTLEVNAMVGEDCRRAVLVLELVPQPRNELAARNEANWRWCRPVGQAVTGCMPQCLQKTLQ